MAANRIYVQVDFQTGQAGAAINALNQSIKGVGGAAQAASSQATSSFGRMSVQVEQMSRQFDRVKSAIIGMATGGAGAGLLRLTSDFQRAQITMTQMTGSAEKAEKTLAELRALSQKQPFEFLDLQNLVTSLSAFGFKGQDLMRTVKAIADSAAGVGGTVEKLNQIGLAIGQIKVKGRLNAEEINKQLGEAGIAASRYLAEELSRQQKKKVTPGEVMKLAELQRLDAEAGLKAIIGGMEKQFGGLGESTTKNVIGAQFSKLADSARFSAVELGEAFTPAARKAFGAIKDLIDKMEPAIKAFRAMPEPVRNTTAALIALAAAVAVLPSLFSFFSFIPANLARAAIAFGTLRTVVTAVLTGMSGALIGSEASLLRLGKAVAVVGAAFAGWELGVWLRENVGPLKEFSDWMQDSVWSKLGFVTTGDAKKGMSAESSTRSSIGEMAAAMRRKGLLIPNRGDSSDEDYARSLREASKPGNAKQDPAITESLLKANEAAIKASVDGARAKLEQTKRQLATGIFKIEPEHAEHFKSARDAGAGEAIKLLRESVAIEINRELQNIFGGLLSTAKGGTTFIPGSMARDLNAQMDTQREEYTAHVLGRRADRLGNNLGFSAEAMGISNAVDMKTMAGREDDITHSRDLQLKSLEAVQAVTLDQKIALERKKFEIEVEADNKLLDQKKRMLGLEFDAELLMLEVRLRANGATNDQILNMRLASYKKYFATIEDFEDETTRRREIREKELSVDATNLAIDQQRRSYDSLKGSAEKVFDALLNRSSNVFAAIGNAFKTAMLTAIREVVTSRIAASLMQMFGLGQVSFVQGGGHIGGSPVFGGARSGGGASGIAAMLGLGGVGTLGGGMSGGGGMFGGGMSGGGFPGGGMPGIGFPGAPGGTGGFAGPVGSVSGSAQPGGAGGGARGLLGGAAGMGSMLFNSGSIAMGNGAATTAAGLGGIKGGLAGVGSSSAALIGGPLLMMAGMQQQNKWARLGMMTGGGLLTGFAIGAKIGALGGPMGALIGAAIGGGIALLMMLKKTPLDKAKAAIKSTYGVDVWDKGVLGQVANLAISNFGGNYALAVQSPQIREMIQMWAQMTGQKAGGIPPKAESLTLGQTGGSLYQSPGFSNGMAMPMIGGGMISGGGMQNGSTSLVIRLDGAATTDLLRGEAVQAIADNPRVSQAAVMSATQGSTGRREMLSLQLSPGTVTS